jgi:hypothetical protein
MKRLFPTLLTLILVGCGADVGSAAVTTAALRAKEAETNQKLKEQAAARLEDSATQHQQRLDTADQGQR